MRSELALGGVSQVRHHQPTRLLGGSIGAACRNPTAVEAPPIQTSLPASEARGLEGHPFVPRLPRVVFRVIPLPHVRCGPGGSSTCAQGPQAFRSLQKDQTPCLRMRWLDFLAGGLPMLGSEALPGSEGFSFNFSIAALISFLDGRFMR